LSDLKSLGPAGSPSSTLRGGRGGRTGTWALRLGRAKGTWCESSVERSGGARRRKREIFLGGVRGEGSREAKRRARMMPRERSWYTKSRRTYGEPHLVDLDIGHVKRCENLGRPEMNGLQGVRVDIVRGYCITTANIHRRPECWREI